MGKRRPTRRSQAGWWIAVLVVLAWCLAPTGTAVAGVAAGPATSTPALPPADAVPTAPRRLDFVRDGTPLPSLDLTALRERCGSRVVELDDPYYEGRKRFLAVSLRCALEQGFGAPVASLRGQDLLFVAADGYTKLVRADVLLGADGWLAFSDADLGTAENPRFAAIDRRGLDPSPFYLVWPGVSPAEAHSLPWPYQLVRIATVAFATTYPHTIPSGEAEDSAAWAGARTFRSECFSCHSINGEGGKIGPDLNVPRSIVEYRPEAQIKEYIRNPASFRYTTMPAHEHLTDRQLDELIAYFHAMRVRKHDPGQAR